MFRHQQLFIPSLESLSNYTKGALLYGVFPVCVLRKTEQSGHLNVRTVLRHYVPNKGLRPLCCFAAILVDINCLTNTPLRRGDFFRPEHTIPRTET